MNDKVAKSQMVSNTHQVVFDSDKRIKESVRFANRLYEVYGDRRPPKYTGCCNTFLTFLGKKGYLDHPKDNAILLKKMMEDGKVMPSKLIEVLEKFGLGNTDLTS